MWGFFKIKGGYVRQLSVGDTNRFIFEILSHDINRSIWRKLCQKIICAVFSHKESSICIQKGFSNERGEFRIVLCRWCLNKVLFYERSKEDE